MKNIFNKTSATILIFTIAILSAFLSHYYPDFKSFIWILLTISLLYFYFGWWLFKAYYPEGKTIVLFLMGYFYSVVFIAQTFTVADWPFAKTLLQVSLFMVLAQLITVVILKKKIPSRGFIQFLIEAALLMAITLFQIIKY